MKKNKKKIFRIAALLCTAGLAISVLSLFAVGFDIKKLGTAVYETNTYSINEEFDRIEMDSYTANIQFLPSTDGVCKVVCYEEEKIKHSVRVQDGSLEIKATDMRHWYDYIGMSFEKSDVTIYLPETEYNALTVKSNTGDIEMPEDFWFETVTLKTDTGDIWWSAPVEDTLRLHTDTGSIEVKTTTAGEIIAGTDTGRITIDGVAVEGMLDMETATGRIKLSEVSCKNINVKGSTGSITLKHTVALGDCFVSSSTGDVFFESFDAASILVKTGTGDVAGTLRSEKRFVTETGTGNISVPNTSTGGTCEITTGTGDIEIELEGN